MAFPPSPSITVTIPSPKRSWRTFAPTRKVVESDDGDETAFSILVKREGRCIVEAIEDENVQQLLFQLSVVEKVKQKLLDVLLK